MTQKATLTQDTVGILARWVHKAALTCGEGGLTTSWVKLSPEQKALYRRLAERMMREPPDVLREALRRLDREFERGKVRQKS